MSWTDERVELLRQLWLDGRSASQISAQLGHGVTRNAVIGKVHRLGLAGRAKAPAAASAPRPTPRRRAAPGAGGGGGGARAATRGATALAMVSRAGADTAPGLPRRGCRRADVAARDDCRTEGGDVPLAARRSDLAGFRYCGSPSPGIGPYCVHHGKLAYQPLQDRRRERDRERALLRIDRSGASNLACSLVERIAGAAHSADRVAFAARDSALRSRPTWTSTVRSSISTAWPQTPSSNCARENTRPGRSSEIFEQAELGRPSLVGWPIRGAQV